MFIRYNLYLSMTMKKVILIALALVLLINISYAQEKHNVTIYFFYGEGCPHCAAEKPFLEKLEAKYPELTIKYYETWHNKTNADLFVAMSAACGSKVVGVPTLFVGHKPIIGFTTEQQMGKQIDAEVIKYINEGGVDLMQRLGKNETSCPSEAESDIIDVPLFGKLDISKVSLPAITIIIGLLDGFNPCAMWVLLFLLALLVYTRSRKRMLILGGSFIFISGLVYYVFMAAWLNFFLLIGYLPYLRAIVGGVAVIFGLINIKDLFFFKKGVSLSIPESAKPKLFESMRKIVHEGALPLALLSIAVLAFTVNTIELLCTAGFPVIYTKILTLNNLSPLAYYSYLALYILMYMIDDFLVFLIAVITLSSKKLTEKQGKWMKFIAGFMMLVLGLLLIFRPELLMFR